MAVRNDRGETKLLSIEGCHTGCFTALALFLYIILCFKSSGFRKKVEIYFIRKTIIFGNTTGDLSRENADFIDAISINFLA